MTMQAVSSQANDPSVVAAAIRELQRLKVSVVAGAAAGTKMNIAALREEDTLVSAVVTTDAGGALADDTANITVQSVKASGTLTVTGNPSDAETFVVGDNTYTFKTTPTAIEHVKITAGDNNAIAASIASAINSVEAKRTATGNQPTPNVVATVATNVVTITSTTEGLGNAPVISGTVTVLAATNSGTAQATLTAATVVADNTCVINGVTFTAKVAPTGDVQFKTTAAATSDALCAADLARVINAYEAKYGSLGVVAAAVGAACNITPRYRKTGNITVLTEAATNVAASGSGTLANGTATGGIKSATNLTGKSLIVTWFDKN